MCSTSFPFVYFHNVPLHFMIFFSLPPPSLHTQALFLLPGLDEHQVRGRNLRRGGSLSSEHICRPAVHMFTPDPSRVDVWAAPARSSLYIASIRPNPPTPKRVSFLLSRKSSPAPQPQMSHRVAAAAAAAAVAAALGVSPRPRKNQRAELLRTL